MHTKFSYCYYPPYYGKYVMKVFCMNVNLFVITGLHLISLLGCRDDQTYLTETVNVGEDVTLTCSRQSIQGESGYLFWIRFVLGNSPEALGATYTFSNAHISQTPRITAKQEPGTFVLHITKTEMSDTAFYYCEKHVELRTTFLNFTFLRVRGKWSTTHFVCLLQMKIYFIGRVWGIWFLTLNNYLGTRHALFLQCISHLMEK